MKILNSKQIKEADKATIASQKITSLELMERAAEKLLLGIKEECPTADDFMVFCGAGNNGGDGLAIVRMLYKEQKRVLLYILKGNYTEEFNVNLQKIKELNIDYTLLETEEQIEKLNWVSPAVTIDALFGVGLSRPLTGLAALLVQKINHFQNYIISIDVPSGLSPDATHISTPQNTIKADLVLSVQLPKLAFFFADNQSFVYKFKCVNISLSSHFLEEEECHNFYTLEKDIKKIFLKRPKFGHKGTFGHSLVIAGSEGKIGAAILSAKAALKTGCGLLTAYIPEKGMIPMHTYFPEAMVISRENPTGKMDFSIYDAIAFGSGMGKTPESKAILTQLLTEYKGKMVIDADGLNILAENRDLYEYFSPNHILTPHPKEFDRLTHSHSGSYERCKTQISFAKEHQVCVVLKGHHTSIAITSGNCYFNSTGNNGMATAGSGDVLTGIITSLCAQGYSPENAAVMGVYLHGYAGDVGAEKWSKHSLVASDIIEEIGAFFRKYED